MIYDCFTFFNELDLLEVRLNILSPRVDKFVLVESDTTFSGKKKPLHFLENKDRYGAFLDRIVHVVADLPEGDAYEDGWRREHASRNAIATGLADAPRDSVVLLSDLDEIPDLRDWDASRVSAVWSHRLFYYYVNMEIDCPILGTVATTLEQFRDDPAIAGLGQKFREWRHYNASTTFQDPRGGWHFSYLGGKEAIKRKLGAFAHAELMPHATDENIEASLDEKWRRGVDLFNREIYKFRLLPDDATLPEYLVANKSRFPQFWKEA